MSETLVDSNLILDILTEDAEWLEWSASALQQQADRSILVINPLVYAEVSIRFERIEDLDEALPRTLFRRDPLPWDVGSGNSGTGFPEKMAPGASGDWPEFFASFWWWRVR